MKSKQQRMDVKVSQSVLNYSKRTGPQYIAYIAQVLFNHADRMTCDIITPDGQKVYNVPVQTIAGLIDGEPYGEFWLPEVDDFVIIRQASEGTRKAVIVGTFVPYLSNDFLADAVNSGDKQFTKKLLEEGTEKHYKRIFKSGSTVEVKEDGTIIVETPRGAYIQMDEDGPGMTVSDPDGNTIVINSDGMVLTDANDNSVTMDSSGMKLEDANGNDVTMGSSSITMNGNLEVLQ